MHTGWKDSKNEFFWASQSLCYQNLIYSVWSHLKSLKGRHQVSGALNQKSLVLTLHRPNIAEAIQKNLGSFSPRKSHFFGLMHHWACFSGMENDPEYESRFRPLYRWDWDSLYWPLKELNLLLFCIGFIWQTTNTAHNENVLLLTLIVYLKKNTIKKYEQYSVILTSILFIWVFKQGLAVSPGINITITSQIYLCNIWKMKYIQPLHAAICYTFVIISS